MNYDFKYLPVYETGSETAQKLMKAGMYTRVCNLTYCMNASILEVVTDYEEVT